MTPPQGQPAVPPPFHPPPSSPPGPPPGVAGGPPAPPPARSTGLIVAAAVVGVLALLAIVAVAVLALGGGDGGEQVTTGGTTAPTFDDVTTTTTRPPATTQPPTGGGGGDPADPTQLPSGLLCRDLRSRGYNYAEAVAYWAGEGRPDRMDEDRNGYPCETVYDTADVVAYWGFDPQAGGAGGDGSVYDLPSGLFCRDLLAMGYSYVDAVTYWNLEGQPSRMVAAELPCETTYPTADVVAYWNQFAD